MTGLRTSQVADASVHAGWDDLGACAGAECCPIPFAASAADSSD